MTVTSSAPPRPVRPGRYTGLEHLVATRDVAWSARLAAAHGPLLDHVLPWLGRTANHSRLWLGLSAGLAGTGDRSARRAAARGLVGIALASPTANVLAKRFVRRPRPLADSVPLVRRLRRTPLTTSFPSGHSASAAAFATGASLENPVLGVPVAVVAGGVAVSRVVTGAHFPTDVAAGCLLGVAAGFTTLAVWPRRTPAMPARARPAAAPASAAGEGVEIVVNSGAGSASGRFSRSGRLLEQLRDALPAATITEVDHDLFETALSTAAERCDILGVAGGDGSVNAAARHALRKQIPLMVIPAGTLNHFARDLGVRSADDAVRAVRAGQAVEVDVATAGSAIFLNTCSAGIYTDLVEARREFEAGLGKWPAMVVGLIRVLARSKPVDLRIDGRRRKVWVFFAGNSRYGAPAEDDTRADERADLADGLVDVRVVGAERMFSRLRLVAAVLTGGLERSPVYRSAAVRDVRLVSDGDPLVLSLDGEPRECGTTVTVGKLRTRLAVYRPTDVTG